MHIVYEVLRLISVVAFLFYGLSCLFSDGMAAEFERYGLSRFRRFTGALEAAGALGLVAGYVFPPLVIFASGGLALLMLLGVITRVRIGDRVVLMLPAIALLLMNLYVMLYAMRHAGSA